MSRGLILTAAVCAALLVAGDVDAKDPKKAKRAAQAATVMVVVPAVAPSIPGSAAAVPANGELGVLRHFDAINADGKGQLSRGEITAWTEHARAHLVRQVRAANATADGQLSREEALTPAPRGSTSTSSSWTRTATVTLIWTISGASSGVG